MYLDIYVYYYLVSYNKYNENKALYLTLFVIIIVNILKHSKTF